MHQVTKEMIRIYKPLDRDWMNYKVCKENPITFHHIIKAEDGGLFIKENGALLTRTAHEYLHIIECKREDMYRMLNKMFEIINRQQMPPSEDQMFVIEYILKEFEGLYKDKKNSKGKSLIREKYMNRE